MTNNIPLQIRRELKKSSSPQTKASGERFFKERVTMYGVKTPIAISIAKQYNREILFMPKEEVYSLCENLWSSGILEESLIASHFSHLIKKKYEESDFKVFKSWVENYINNWASCDTFCTHTFAEFVFQYPQYLDSLKEWTRSENRWVKRASAVTLVPHARRGRYLPEIFEIADKLLLDEDDLVQKGYGWMLKEASKPHQNEIFEYVLKNKG